MNLRTSLVLAALMLLPGVGAVAQQIAPDATPVGPLPVATGQYDLGARIDNLVLPNCQPRSGYDCKIDIRAEVYRPQVLSGTYPLIIFLHGNHGTCGRPYQSPPDPAGMLGNPRIDDKINYTGTGTCPTGYVESPSYLGYDYAARRLASYGYIVVSIDANRGVTAGPGLAGDNALIKARGILVMRHLQNLSHWNRHGATPPQVGANLQGHIDFNNVGMMGHSRGGDGVRAAYNDYIANGSIWPSTIEDPVTFKGIFEIAPTDFLGNNSKGVAWNIIAGMCDGDVYDLEGIDPYDRDILPPFETSPTQKSTFVVWGANHNFFNTQWQVSDATDLQPPNFPSICTGAGNPAIFPMSPGSAQQRLTAMSALLAFFRANVGSAAEADFNRNFNPWWGVPTTVTDENGVAQPYPTRADRGYTPPSPIKVFEDFTQPTGTSSYGFPNLASNITINHGRVPEHDSTLRAGVISWTSAGQNTYFQTNWTATGSGADISSYTTLELRVSRQNSSLNGSSPSDFSVRIVGTTGTTAALKLSRYLDPDFAGQSGHQSLLQGPVGSTDELHPILQTVRIPLADFPGLALVKKNVHGVRLVFDQSSQGAIYVANIRLSNSAVDLAQQQSGSEDLLESQSSPVQQAPAIRLHSGVIAAVRNEANLWQRNGVAGVEIEIASSNEFPVRDSLLTLQVGSRSFAVSRYAGDDLHRVVFSLTAAEFAALSATDNVMLYYGKKPRGAVWQCGRLNGRK